jgi:hypothetical protein
MTSTISFELNEELSRAYFEHGSLEVSVLEGKRKILLE